jgi:hypothetical protein
MNLLCPSCKNKTLHTKEHWVKYHPYAGHGYTIDHGWSHPDLQAEEEATAKMPLMTPAKPIKKVIIRRASS